MAFFFFLITIPADAFHEDSDQDDVLNYDDDGDDHDWR